MPRHENNLTNQPMTYIWMSQDETFLSNRGISGAHPQFAGRLPLINKTNYYKLLQITFVFPCAIITNPTADQCPIMVKKNNYHKSTYNTTYNNRTTKHHKYNRRKRAINTKHPTEKARYKTKTKITTTTQTIPTDKKTQTPICTKIRF